MILVAFSTDNPRGGHLFKFDRSLMERLDAAGLPMAQLNIQRRMRPEVSTLIRSASEMLHPGTY